MCVREKRNFLRTEAASAMGRQRQCSLNETLSFKCFIHVTQWDDPLKTPFSLSLSKTAPFADSRYQLAQQMLYIFILAGFKRYRIPIVSRMSVGTALYTIRAMIFSKGESPEQ
jgi:hypothetical protein